MRNIKPRKNQAKASKRAELVVDGRKRDIKSVAKK